MIAAVEACLRWTTIGMAALATTALEQSLAEPGQRSAVTLAWTAGLILPLVLVAAWRQASRRAAPTVGPKLGQLSVSPKAIVALIALFVLPFAYEAGRLVLTGRPAMPEVTLLAALRNLGLGLAAMADQRVFAKLSALVSLFLMTVAASLGGEAGMAILVPLAGFAVIGTFWLMLHYWKHLDIPPASRPQWGRLVLSSSAWLLGVVALLAVLAAIGPSRAATAIMGLVPTSGGTDWSDPEARSGVGDGDHEVAASEHPESVGFTESEVYLETDRPSLYDAFNESYGEPFKPKKTDKMIALGQQDVGEQKDRPAENLQAGREFAAVRRKPEPRGRRPGEREAKALVYVKGPTPLHLPLMTYGHFDGTTWSEEPCCGHHFPAEQERRGTWLRLPWPPASFLSGTVTHQIKIGELDSSPMPVPSHVTRFRVGSVNRLDFFGWAQYGIIRMTDRTVPAGTVIDSEARTIDPRRLLSHELCAQIGNDGDHHISFDGDYAINPAVSALAKGWVEGLPEGWCQVAAVIAALRRGYAHDRSATAPSGCTDVVAEFLLQSHRGPDYLFASSAAVLLRSLGYPTRLVSGLYAAPGKYDPRTRHTPVTRDDVHFWVEVRLPNGHWVAVEPTPGYELMPPVLSWSDRLADALLTAARWAQHAPAERAVVLVRAHGARPSPPLLGRSAGDDRFRLTPAHNPRWLVLEALRLIERRARWAGAHGRLVQRSGAGIRRSHAIPRLSHARPSKSSSVLSDWAVHAPERDDQLAPPVRQTIQQTCRLAVSVWTLDRFRPPVPNRA